MGMVSPVLKGGLIFLLHVAPGAGYFVLPLQLSNLAIITHIDQTHYQYPPPVYASLLFSPRERQWRPKQPIVALELSFVSLFTSSLRASR